ncbi:hypothetical protein ACFL2Q_06030 [Thermodesulfobacteriota bacterium]
MRPLTAILIWVILIGGLTAYMHGRTRTVKAPEFQARSAEGSYSVEAVTTFSAEPDPFALRTGSEEGPTALLIKVNGKEILRRDENVPRGRPVIAKDVPGIHEGLNEFYVEAAPPLSQADQAHAVRVRILRDGEPVAERTLWAEPGLKIAATVPLDVEKSTDTSEKDHGR